MENLRWFILMLVFVTVVLQLRIWFSEEGYQKNRSLLSQIDQQRKQNKLLKKRNESLEAEIWDLKNGTESIEERARTDLGYIGDDEIFYFIVEPEN